ncbi:zinc-binding alcohol dehydrogenase family protein [Methylophaga sulfidovorans]|uniref:Zinc-type alcohol dehydrogenase-like protein n=1 Tax=Methylophaga sulfidovorans TaxID=45496 RepID=A0A1I4AI65_9GAMM|nr:zinc-binding alcohol dehydrogenase family protein [Methylophaga sulfidovorans]SFK55621.1 zinc-binding alcohol dehydrogenase family protein [Methylophaga sulfidovorans]
MKAYGFFQANGQAQLIERETPTPEGRDLLIKIDAIAVNPVDTKIKASLGDNLDNARIIGWDACGTVIDAGSECNLFKTGDKVFYSGDVTRDGCYASHQLVDERIVGKAPKTLSAEQAAAMPLTSITAWEALFSRMRIWADLDKGKTILIVGGAGGVGSIAIQLAKKIGQLNVVATASRQESIDWCYELGADHVINHQQLSEHYSKLGLAAPDYILCLGDTDPYYDELTDLLAPQGLICFVVTSQQNHNIDKLKNKSAGIVWEFMFARPMYHTADMIEQHHLLNKVSEMLDNKTLKCTHKQTLGAISVSNIEQAHQLLLTGRTIGKISLSAVED